MIELTNNDPNSEHNVFELSVSSEDGIVSFVVKDAETDEVVLEMTSENLEALGVFPGEVSTAIQGAWGH